MLLSIDEFYGVSKDIDIVKGVNRYPNTIGQAIRIAKRKIMAKSAKENS